jgi:DNA-binding PadR family transcriptional regulator
LASIGRRIESARVYGALADLERAGEVAARESAGDEGRSRRVFHLTERGRGALDRWLDAPVPAGEWLRRPLLAKLALAAATGALAVPALEAELAVRRRALEQSSRTERRARAARAPLPRYARERLRRHLELEIELLERILEQTGCAGAPAARTSLGGAPVTGARAAAISSPRKPPCAASGSR